MANILVKQVKNGIILSMSPRFRNLHNCIAFDASFICDFEEEQKWIIPFMYVQINTYSETDGLCIINN